MSAGTLGGLGLCQSHITRVARTWRFPEDSLRRPILRLVASGSTCPRLERGSVETTAHHFSHLRLRLVRSSSMNGFGSLSNELSFPINALSPYPRSPGGTECPESAD